MAEACLHTKWHLDPSNRLPQYTNVTDRHRQTDRTDSGPIAYRAKRFTNGRPKTWPNGLTDQDETWHAGRPRPWPHCVRWRTSSPSPKRGTALNFGSISVGSKTAGCIIQDATRYGSRRRPRPHCWDPAPPKMGEQQPLLNCWPMSIVAKRSPISATAKLFLCIIKPNKCSAVAEMGDRKEGEAAVSFSGVGAGSPSNRMWPALRSTLVPSDILIHPAVWPQKCGGVLCSCFRGAGSPSNTDTQCGLTQGLPPYQLLS